MDWGWYTDINTKIIFIHMLLKANWKDGVFKDTTVPRGSFVSLIAKLAEETGLTNDEANIEIPKLATGAVLPANREFLALVGDQKHGTNVEAPLDTIRQAQKDAIMEGGVGTEAMSCYPHKQGILRHFGCLESPYFWGFDSNFESNSFTVAFSCQCE